MWKWQKYLNLHADFSHTNILGSEQYLHLCHQGAVNLPLALLAAEMTPSLQLLWEIKLIRLFSIQRFTQGNSICKRKCKWHHAFRSSGWNLCDFFLICLWHRGINILGPCSIPCVTLHLGELLPFLAINDILMTRKATLQPNQRTVICHFPP